MAPQTSKRARLRFCEAIAVLLSWKVTFVRAEAASQIHVGLNQRNAKGLVSVTWFVQELCKADESKESDQCRVDLFTASDEMKVGSFPCNPPRQYLTDAGWHRSAVNIGPLANGVEYIYQIANADRIPNARDYSPARADVVQDIASCLGTNAVERSFKSSALGWHSSAHSDEKADDKIKIVLVGDHGYMDSSADEKLLLTRHKAIDESAFAQAFGRRLPTLDRGCSKREAINELATLLGQQHFDRTTMFNNASAFWPPWFDWVWRWILCKLRTDIVPTWNATPTRNLVVDSVKAGDIDLALIVGDLSYQDDAFTLSPENTFTEFLYEVVYNKYMDWLEPAFSRVPLLVLPGNHESECHSPMCLLHEHRWAALMNYTAYNVRFGVAFQADGAAKKTHQASHVMWQSFYPKRFLKLILANSETDFGGAPCETKGDSKIPFLVSGGYGRDKSEYLRWLVGELENAKDSWRPWTVVMMHRPLAEVDGGYYQWQHKQNGGKGAVVTLNNGTKYEVTSFQELYNDFGVDLFMCGHVHAYARRLVSNNFTVNKLSLDSDVVATRLLPTRFPQVITGGAGNNEMMSPTPKHQDWEEWPVQYSKYSMGYLTASAQELRWELLDSGSREVVDQLVLRRESLDGVQQDSVSVEENILL